MQALCSKKEYCKSEIQAKLLKSELTTDEKKNIIAQLEQEDYINEMRYTKAFVHDKLFLSHWGKIKIQFALNQKKINPVILSEVLKHITKEEYIHVFLPIAKAKWKTIKEENDLIKKQKTITFLIGKGIEYTLADEIVKDFLTS
jgi:regulatory protein